MIKFEDNVYYTKFGNTFKKDEEASGQPRMITEEEAERYQQLIIAMGFKRHENSKQVFYSKMTDSNHCSEYVFWK